MKKLAVFVFALLLAVNVQAVDQVKTGSLTSITCPGTGCAQLAIANGVGTVSVEISGTFVATAQLEAAITTTFFPIDAYPVGGGVKVSAATAPGRWTIAAASFRVIRVRVSAFTSGSVDVTIRASTGTGTVFVNTVSAGAAASIDLTTVNGGTAVSVNSGTVDAGTLRVVLPTNQPAVAVTGPATDTQLRATPLPVSGTVTTGGLTDAQLRATAVPVSGTVTATTGGLTDAQLRATPVPVSGTVTATGPLTDTQLRAANVFVHEVNSDNLLDWVAGVNGPLTVAGTFTPGALSSYLAGLTTTGVNCLATYCAFVNLQASDAASIVITVAGTFVATISFESSTNSGVTGYGPMTCWPLVNNSTPNFGSPVSSTTAPGTWVCPVVGVEIAHARISAYTSGSVSLGVRESLTTNVVFPWSTSALPIRVDPTGATTQPVSLTSTTITGSVAVTGPLTDTQLRASAVPVTANAGTNLNTSALALDATLTNRTQKAQITDGTRDGTVKAASTLPLATDTAFVVTQRDAVAISGTVPVSGPLTDAQLRASAVPVTAAQATPGNLQATVTPIALTKGTQGATGFSTQDLHDAGRVAISFYANNFAAGATTVEKIITWDQSKNTGAVVAATASYTVTSGKTLRITGLQVATRGHATATIQTTTFNLRVNTAGACVVTSTPIVFAAQSATPATASAWDRVIIPIPDGYEIAGNGTVAICITANSTFVTNAPTWAVNLIGYEY